MAPELVVLPAERVDAIAAQAQQLGAAALVRAIERLGSALVDMRHAPDPRILVEVALVQLTHEEAAGDTEVLAARVERLEATVKQLREAGFLERHVNVSQIVISRPDERGYCYEVGEVEGEDIGYVFSRLIDRPENPFMHAWRYIYIDQISIKPRFQGMGYGGLLMERVRDLAKENDIATIALDTWALNEGAQSFFNHEGFVTFNLRMWQSTHGN